LADQTADNSDSYLAALSCYDAADEILTRSNDPNNRAGLIRACRAYCFNRTGQHNLAIIQYRDAIKAGFENERVHNNLGYSYRVGSNIESDKKRIEYAERELNTALQQNDNLQAAHYNRALLHTEIIAKVPRYYSDSPQMDIDRAVLLDSPSGRLCLDAAHLYAFGAPRYGEFAQKYTEQAQAGYSGAFALGASHGMARFVCESVYLACAESEARFHREQAIAYLRQALEKGQKCEREKEDLFLKPLFKEIKDDLNVMPVAERDLLLLDPVKDEKN
jgi:tetratricopeptide (TPR) repeat protein